MLFMSLPLEIRLLILHFAICLPLDSPACPSVSQYGRRRLPNKRTSNRIQWHNAVWQLPLTNPAFNILLVNHQLHDEVKDVLRFIPARYHVDIMFVKTHGFWPTWSVAVMPRSQYIDAVSCTLRLFEPTPDLDKRFARSLSFRRGDGGPPSGAWSFHNLLAQLFDFGPGFLKPRRSRYVVGSIMIDIVAPTDAAPHSSFGQPEEDLKQGPTASWRSHAYDGRRKGDILIEKTLSSYLVDYFTSLVLLNYYTTNYGMFLWECVLDRIVFSVNGKKVESFEMEHICQTHVPQYWGESPSYIEERKRDWGVWRTWLMERRGKMRDGLEVQDDSPVRSIM